MSWAIACKRLFGVAGPGRDRRAAERVRAALHDEAARRQVVGEAIEDDFAGLKPRRRERRRRAPEIRRRNPAARRSSPARANSRLKRPGVAAARPPKGGAARCIAGRSDLRNTGMRARSARLRSASISTPSSCRASAGLRVRSVRQRLAQRGSRSSAGSSDIVSSLRQLRASRAGPSRAATACGGGSS